VVDLHDRDDRRRRGPWIARVAAAVLVIAVSAAAAISLMSGGDDGARVGTTPATDVLPAPTPTPTGPVTTMANGPTTATAGTTPATVADRRDEARVTALAWIDHLAAGETRAAWDLLGPATRRDWGSYDRFADARTGFAEGLGSWASAPDRTVSTTTVSTDVGKVHVVTFSGVRQAEGMTELATEAIVVIDDRPGRQLVERRVLTAGAPTATAPEQRYDPVRVTGLPPETGVVMIVDDDGLFSITRDGDTAVHRPASGWSPGRHTVTAVVIKGPDVPMALPVVFDLP
jgi:hypothetical protein